MPRTADGTPVDLVMSPISVISRMNLGQILEANLAHAGLHLNKRYAVPVFEKYPESRITDELEAAGLNKNCKVQLYDGRTGEAYDQQTVVGVAYILKLVHMVDDKVHSRSTGPYSLVTQQPLGGKARMGGQRLGEMEVWALEAHRAAHTLREMLTIKSDDIDGRTHAFQSIIKGEPIPEPAIPESFKVLTKELAGLALDISPVGVKEIDLLPEEETPNPDFKPEDVDLDISTEENFEAESDGLTVADSAQLEDETKEEQ